jgi:hypothetical protein
MRNLYKIRLRKHEEKIPLGETESRWEIILKYVLNL